jgi:hypothetical protein
VIFPVPKEMARTLALLLEKKPVVSVKLARLRVPDVSVNVLPLDSVKAPPSVKVPVVFVIGELIVTPFVVMVVLPVKVRSPVADQVTVFCILKTAVPKFIVPVPSNVPVKSPLIPAQFNAPERVTVTPVKEVKVVASVVVGTEAPTVAYTIDC